MAEWGRDTPWRQGHVLAAETAKELGLVCQRDPDATIAIVISHDCDLAQLPSIEPNVEVIAGCIAKSSDGNFTHAKNVRRLQLPFSSANGEMIVDLLAVEKASLPKARLADQIPRADLRIEPSGLSILQQWLAVRYRRAAFPDEFDRRLEETGMREKLGKIMKSLGTHLPAVFFDVDDGVEVNRQGSAEPFVLDIYLLYAVAPDPVVAEKDAIEAKAKIERAFTQTLNSEGKGWKEIELRSCEIVSEEALSYRLSRVLKQWRQDHISLREDPPHVMMAE